MMLRFVENLMRSAFVSKRIRLLLLMAFLACLSACDGSEPEGRKPPPPAPLVGLPKPVVRPDLDLPEGEPTDEDRIAFYLGLLEGGDEDEVRWASEQLALTPQAAAGPLGEMLARNVVRNPLLAQNILQTFATVVPAPDQVEAMTTAAKSTDSLLRFTTAPALGNSGSEDAVPVLLDLLSDPDGRVATAAVRALEGIGSDAGLQGIVGRFPEQMHLSAATAAIPVMAKVLPRERLLPILQTAFESDQPALLISAGVALMDLDRDTWLPRVREKLCPLLESQFAPAVQNALAHGRDPELLPALIEDSAATDRDTALFAIQRLMNYRTDGAIQAFWKATRAEDDDIRREAWFALLQAEQENAPARLTALLSSPDPRDRIVAAEVLAARPEHPSGPAFAAALEKEENFAVARKLATGIALLGYREGATAIAGLLSREVQASPFQSVDASAASTSLLKLGRLPPPAVVILVGLASSPNEAIRVNTARALGRACSGPRVRDALAALLRDPSVHVRDQALVSWLALDDATVDVLVATYAAETDPDVLKRMRKVVRQLIHRWPQ